MKLSFPWGLRAQELQNIAGVSIVSILLVGLIALLSNQAVLGVYPDVVHLGSVFFTLLIAGMAPKTLSVVTTAETRLILIFLLMASMTAGSLLIFVSGSGFWAVIIGVVGFLVGVGASLAIQSLSFPDHSILPGIWIPFFGMSLFWMGAIGRVLFQGGDLSMIFILAFLIVILYIVHQTLIRERKRQTTYSTP
ncbi:hypothetical protein ACLI4Q_06050 [Natrialbaceae archaeon A-CW1-1]